MGNDVKGSGMVIGGSENLPASIFGKEMMMRDKEGGDKEGMKEFVRNYSHAELGEKLKMLRPIKKEEKGWFSWRELNDRLMKVREIEVNESKSKAAGDVYRELKETLYKLTQDGDLKAKKTTMSEFAFFNFLGAVSVFFYILGYMFNQRRTMYTECYAVSDLVSVILICSVVNCKQAAIGTLSIKLMHW